MNHGKCKDFIIPDKVLSRRKVGFPLLFAYCSPNICSFHLLEKSSPNATCREILKVRLKTKSMTVKLNGLTDCIYLANYVQGDLCKVLLHGNLSTSISHWLELVNEQIHTVIEGRENALQIAKE